MTKRQVCTHQCPDHRENQDQQPLLATLRKALDAQEKNDGEVFEDRDEPGGVVILVKVLDQWLCFAVGNVLF